MKGLITATALAMLYGKEPAALVFIVTDNGFLELEEEQGRLPWKKEYVKQTSANIASPSTRKEESP